MQRLSRRTLDTVLAGVILPPEAALEAAVGIVHLGLGAFHRGHQALLTQRALAVQPGAWAISGASLRSAAVPAALRPQDCLYSVIENDGMREEATIVGSVREALLAAEDGDDLLARIAAPSTRIVTLTVTEKGYCHHPATGDLDLTHPQIMADLTGRTPPQSTLGWLVRGLDRRRQEGAGRLTVLCCDNMASNGRTLRRLVEQFAGAVDPNLATWIADEVRFPSSMVDRIVPAATPASLDHASGLLGVRDAAAVSCESFAQWVIEDDFAAGRPAWEAAGAELVSDVGPHQDLKLRLLNGAHSAIAYIGALLGLPFVSDVMAEPALAGFVERLMLDEVAPLTELPAGYDVNAYARALLRRFANASLQHRTLQIAMDGSQKIPVRWLPVLRHGLRQGLACPRLVTSIAVWFQFLIGVDEAGRDLPLEDPLAGRLRAMAAALGSDPTSAVQALLSVEEVFGRDLRENVDLGRRLATALGQIGNLGLRATLSKVEG
jgi:fructuronate reductase